MIHLRQFLIANKLTALASSTICFFRLQRRCQLLAITKARILPSNLSMV
jgi:hypothetical protein